MSIVATKRKLVGICGGQWGDSGVGKTTLANILAKEMGFYPASFAEPIKDVARKIFGWDGAMNAESRLLLDRICRMGRSISEDYWRDLVMTRLPKDQDKIAFDDVYFDNEMRLIIGNGGIIVRIVRGGFNTPTFPCVTIDIENNGSLTDFSKKSVLTLLSAIEDLA